MGIAGRARTQRRHRRRWAEPARADGLVVCTSCTSRRGGGQAQCGPTGFESPSRQLLIYRQYTDARSCARAGRRVAAGPRPAGAARAGRRRVLRGCGAGGARRLWALRRPNGFYGGERCGRHGSIAGALSCVGNVERGATVFGRRPRPRRLSRGRRALPHGKGYVAAGQGQGSVSA